MARDPIIWQRFEWKSGADSYVFEIQQGGLFGTLSAPSNRIMTLPMVAWEGMLESVRVTRKAQTQPQSRAVSAGMPQRSGSRWTEPEVEQLVEQFKAGRTIAQLADAHARSAYAVEIQLERNGLLTPDEKEADMFPRDRFAEI